MVICRLKSPNKIRFICSFNAAHDRSMIPRFNEIKWFLKKIVQNLPIGNLSTFGSLVLDFIASTSDMNFDRVQGMDTFF